MHYFLSHVANFTILFFRIWYYGAWPVLNLSSRGILLLLLQPTMDLSKPKQNGPSGASSVHLLYDCECGSFNQKTHKKMKRHQANDCRLKDPAKTPTDVQEPLLDDPRATFLDLSEASSPEQYLPADSPSNKNFSSTPHLERSLEPMSVLEGTTPTSCSSYEEFKSPSSYPSLTPKRKRPQASRELFQRARMAIWVFDMPNSHQHNYPIY